MSLINFVRQGAAVYLVSDKPINLTSLDGSGVLAGYLQIHDLAALPVGGEVPLYSFSVNSAGALPSIFETLGPITLKNGLVVAFSSTEATHTSPGVGAGFISIYGTYENQQGIHEHYLTDYFHSSLSPTVVSAIGNDVDVVTNLELWNTAADPNTRMARVLTIKAKSSGTYVPSYLFLFADNHFTADSKPLFSWPLTTADLLLDFGDEGLLVYDPNLKTTGCYLVQSTHGDRLTMASPDLIVSATIRMAD